MVVTGYCKCGKCCNWRRNWLGRPVIKSGPNKGKRKKVGYTASGVKAKIGTIAADTSRYPFGTVMHVPGYGYGRVEDRGGDIKGDRIDLFFKSHKAAVQWGKKELRVKVWLKK
jgi:3D (Asp-Asp-Asp) domain-containing protein